MSPRPNLFKRLIWRLFYTNALAGKFVELRGNRGHLDGLTFDLDNPYIATFLKGRFLFNTYESSSVKLVNKYVAPDLPLVELGGCIGVTACLINRTLRDPTRHVVVEAHPGLVPTLTRNRELNQSRFEIVEGAIAYGKEAVSFWLHPEYFVGGSSIALRNGEEVTVKSLSLESLIRDRGFERVTLVSDIQGGEVDLVKHEMGVLQNHVDTMVMEVHPAAWGAGEEATNQMLRALQDKGFEIVARIRNDVVLKNRALPAS